MTPWAAFGLGLFHDPLDIGVHHCLELGLIDGERGALEFLADDLADRFPIEGAIDLRCLLGDWRGDVAVVFPVRLSVVVLLPVGAWASLVNPLLESGLLDPRAGVIAAGARPAHAWISRRDNRTDRKLPPCHRKPLRSVMLPVSTSTRTHTHTEDHLCQPNRQESGHFFRRLRTVAGKQLRQVSVFSVKIVPSSEPTTRLSVSPSDTNLGGATDEPCSVPCSTAGTR